MVHALHEAHRVLKPNGLLLDLRPGPKHRRVGIVRGRRWREVGAMREKFDDDRAANAAVAHVLREGLFRRQEKRQVDLRRSMDTLKDFRAWIDEFVQLADLPSHDWLIERVKHALIQERGKAKITVQGPLQMWVMRKLGASVTDSPQRHGEH
jgi:hypothetical protein